MLRITPHARSGFVTGTFCTRPGAFLKDQDPAVGPQRRIGRTLALEELAADDFGHGGHLLLLELLGRDAGVEVVQQATAGGRQAQENETRCCYTMMRV